MTKRIILRDINPEDEKDLIRNINNLEVSKYLILVPHPYTKKDAKWWINNCEKAAKEKPRKKYSFSIELKSKKGVIGAVGLEKIDFFQGTATIGYWLGEDYWRQGIMQEATRAVIDYAFKKLKLRRIDVEAFAENKGSNALIKKLGFKYEGTMKKKCRAKATGKIHDAHFYGLLKNNWK